MVRKFRGYGLVALAVMAGVMAAPVGAQDAAGVDKKTQPTHTGSVWSPRARTIAQATELDGALWVRMQTGRVHVLHAPDWALNAPVEAGVDAMAVSGNDLYIAKAAGAPHRDLPYLVGSHKALQESFPMSWNTSVLVKRGDRFVPFIDAVPMDVPSVDFPIALLMQGTGTKATALFLTKNAIYSAKRGAKKWRRTALTRETEVRLIDATKSVVASPDGKYLYVGSDRGEWGGDVEKIEVASGRVTLHKMTAPVTSILTDPTAEDCIILSTGLSHLNLRRGEIGRLCGSTYTTLFKQPLKIEWGEFSAPIERLVSDPNDKNSYFAISESHSMIEPDILYRFKYGQADPIETIKLPAKRAEKVSFPYKGVAEIQSGENWLLGRGQIVSWK